MSKSQSGKLDSHKSGLDCGKSFNDNKLYIFLHMPKCAGTTFRVHIEKNLTKDEILPLYVSRDKRYTDRGFLEEYVKSLPDERKRKLKLVYGHEVYYGIHELLGRQGCYFTFLRNPVPRTISWYNYRRQKNWVDKKIIEKFVNAGITPTIGEWLENSPWVWNEAMGYLADFGYCEKKNEYTEHELESVLDLFFFVGLTDTFDKDALFLYSLLGVRKNFFRSQNISKKFFDPDEGKLIERDVLDKNIYDMKLYEMACQRHGKIKETLPSYKRKVMSMQLLRAVSRILRGRGEFMTL